MPCQLLAPSWPCYDLKKESALIKVYIDTGGWMPALRQLKEAGLVETIHFAYEQRLKRMDEVAPASALTWQSAATWNDLRGQTWASTAPSDRFIKIEAVIGAGNHRDTQHLDSAYKGKCQAFLTSDKGDIWKHRDALFKLLDVQVFHASSEWLAFEKFCKDAACNA